MASRPLEYCCACEAPTGRAGQGEDSLRQSRKAEEKMSFAHPEAGPAR